MFVTAFCGILIKILRMITKIAKITKTIYKIKTFNLNSIIFLNKSME